MLSNTNKIEYRPIDQERLINVLLYPSLDKDIKTQIENIVEFIGLSMETISDDVAINKASSIFGLTETKNKDQNEGYNNDINKVRSNITITNNSLYRKEIEPLMKAIQTDCYDGSKYDLSVHSSIYIKPFKNCLDTSSIEQKNIIDISNDDKLYYDIRNINVIIECVPHNFNRIDAIPRTHFNFLIVTNTEIDNLVEKCVNINKCIIFINQNEYAWIETQNDPINSQINSSNPEKQIKQNGVNNMKPIIKMIKAFLTQDTKNRFKLSFVSFHHMLYDGVSKDIHNENLEKRKIAIIKLLIGQLTDNDIIRIDVNHIVVVINNPKTG